MVEEGVVVEEGANLKIGVQLETGVEDEVGVVEVDVDHAHLLLSLFPTVDIPFLTLPLLLGNLVGPHSVYGSLIKLLHSLILVYF